MDGLQAGQILKQEGMNAELLEVGEKTLVVSKPTGFNLHAPNVLITIEGAFQTGIAKGIVRMLNETQCSECGKFNGSRKGGDFHFTHHQPPQGGESLWQRN